MSGAHEWLNLIEVSGPFLAEPVLRQALPDGLDTLEKGVASRLRSAYDEWREAVDDRDPRLDQLHAAWIDEVLTNVLDYDDGTLLRGDRLPRSLFVDLPEHGASLRPDMVLVEPVRPDVPLMLVAVMAPAADLDASARTDGFVASPKDRMVSLLRGCGCPIGLVTNGEAWMIVHAPEGAVTSIATWYARMFGLERETLRAFASLLGIRRFTGPESDRLPSLFARSLQHQGDVTEALGDQVAQAIEVLMRALDRADQDRNRELLKDVAPKTLYEAGLTLMMRLVVILSAEERELLLLGDPIYDAHYAISSMRSQLLVSDPAVLAAREEAWSRLLATFRLVYAGSDHPDLRLPALGGSLFDPDRFPFLEGRKTGSSWKEVAAMPLPIDDRTVLLLLDAIQTFRGRALSYKALDVEQIGHVYEGLLDQTAGRVEGVTLQLKGSSKARTPLVALADLEKARRSGLDKLVELLVERTERSETALRNDLTTTPEKSDIGRLLTSCRGDLELRDRILPFVQLVADDPWGMPLVHQAGAIVIVKGMDRRDSGSHYTPKSLTEKIVEETLTPVVYRGPAEGTDRKDWDLKSPAELLDLKICDPAMGSGAFLVQVCRWLGDRVVEAWAAAEADGRWVDTDGVVHDAAESVLDPMIGDTESRTVEARRLIAERCLYGVDMNPLAVELAKLSLWLTTVAKGRPFGFLDHNLRHGDSLLGIDDLDQVIELEMCPRRSDQLRLFGRSIGKAVEVAMRLRRELRAHPVRDIEDVEAMMRLDAESRRQLELPIIIADAFIGCVLAEKKGRMLEDGISTIAALADAAAGGKLDSRDALIRMAKRDLAKDEPHERLRKPFHWPLEFPEVFGRENNGFDAFVGNPPFLGGQRITGAMGTVYREYLVESLAGGMRGSADFVAYFFLRAYSLLSERGLFGLIAVNTIAEGDTRDVGLGQLLKAGGQIIAAYPNEVWPGAANVVTSRVHMAKSNWTGSRQLNGKAVAYISSHLGEFEAWSPKKLESNAGLVFQGSIILGDGFLVDEDFVATALAEDPEYEKVLYPYLIGREVNQHPEHEPGRHVINFFDWSEDASRRYSSAFAIVERKVRSEREKQNDAGAKRAWWLHLRPRPELYHKIGRGELFKSHPSDWTDDSHRLERVIVFATGATKYPCFTMVPNEYVYAHSLCVIANDSFGLLGCLSSDIHTVWAWEQGSRMKQDLRYTHGDIFETFPLPDGLLGAGTDRLCELGEELFRTRREVMRAEQKGLTSFYNDFHSPTFRRQDVARCREVQASINESVLEAYGLEEINLELGFHEVGYLPHGKNTRFTMSEKARREILHRLAELNRQRYQEEVEQGLHGDVKPANKPKPVRPTKPSPNLVEPSIGLDLPVPPQPKSNETTDALLAFLRANPGRHGRPNLFRVRRMTNAEFTAAMDELVAAGLVVRDLTGTTETYMISERGKNG